MAKKTSALLRRTAIEVKKYRMISRILPMWIGTVTVFLALVYTITVFYSRYGSFTVTVNKFDNVKYALTLSETPDFMEQTSYLNSKASEKITNIDGRDLPADIDSINGQHNGKNYVAYTFYCKNAGNATVTYEYQLYIKSMTLDIEKAVRVRLYVNGEYVDYARTRTDGGGAEPGTTEFMTETIIKRDQISGFAPGDMTKYTVVIWLEGNDPDCVDEILGGKFKIDMSMTIIGGTEEEKQTN